MIKITLLFLATSLTGLNVPVSVLSTGLNDSIITEKTAEAMDMPSVAEDSLREETKKEIKEEKLPKDGESAVKSYFVDTPIMIEVARCESTFRHTDKNGEVLRGVQNNQDVGIMQINERFHLERAEKLGINIYTLEGNLEYARYLYQKEGTTPWRASQKCWKR